MLDIRILRELDDVRRHNIRLMTVNVRAAQNLNRELG